MEQVNMMGVQTTTIHFIHELLQPPPSQEGPPVMQWRIACMPNMVEFGETAYHPNYPRSDDVRAVTCPACKKTDGYKRAVERSEIALRGVSSARS